MFDRYCAGDRSSAKSAMVNDFSTVCTTTVAPVLKNPAFKEEAEWRYVHLAIPGTNMQFLPRPLGLRPYIDIDFKVLMKETDPAPPYFL